MHFHNFSTDMILEVGGGVQPGNRFVSFVRAMRSCVCARETMLLLGLGGGSLICAPVCVARALPLLLFLNRLFCIPQV